MDVIDLVETLKRIAAEGGDDAELRKVIAAQGAIDVAVAGAAVRELHHMSFDGADVCLRLASGLLADVLTPRA